MLELKNIDYYKEYYELLEAFIPKFKDKGLEIYLERKNNILFLKIDGLETSLEIENYFPVDKSNLKRTIYKFLSEYRKKELTWGMLVGVNPLKLFRKLEKDLSRSEAIKILEEGYFLSKKKIELGFKVIDNQKDIYKNQIGKNSVYIDIPFCPTKCKYCAYPTHLIDEEKMDLYVEGLLKEIDIFYKNTKLEISNVYIGGGTPSAIGYIRLEKVISKIRKLYKNIEEFTVEIGRPDTINRELLEMLSDYSIDRISINPQTMKNSTLDLIGRKHSSDDIISSFKLSRDLGFKNINMDLIIGLPSENDLDFENSLKEIIKLGAESISIHALAMKKSSSLSKNSFEKVENFTFEDKRDYLMENSSYIPYYLYRQKNIYLNIENIGYSKLGFESKYNIAMMEDIGNIFGFGLASTSKLIKNGKIVRNMNPRIFDEYVKNVEDNTLKKIKILGEN